MGLGTGKKRGTRRGLTFKVLVVVPFCIALAIQGVMCVAVLAGSETLEQMEADAYDLVSERVSSRAGYLENDMIFRWSDFDVVVDDVGDDIGKRLLITKIEGDAFSLVSEIDTSGMMEG